MYEKSIYFFDFQRQSLIKENLIPKFSSITLWKYVFISCVPLLALFMAFYAIAFTADSLGLLIWSIGFMLNPIVSIPVGLFMTSILGGINQLYKRICNAPASESRYKFTITGYLALICAIQIYFTSQWDTVRDTSIQVSLHGVKSYWGELWTSRTSRKKAMHARLLKILPPKTLKNLSSKVAHIPTRPRVFSTYSKFLL